MAASRGPRIGRPDRLAALPERSAERFQGFRGLTGPPRVSCLLAATVPADSPAPTARPRWTEVQERAQQLAAALTPLPTALDEIATRISRHCAVTHRDAELAQVVEAMRARTFALWRAVDRLAEAAGGRNNDRRDDFEGEPGLGRALQHTLVHPMKGRSQ
jgi:hypothetical protein